MEFDPFSKNKKLKESKIILGSFPTWSITEEEEYYEKIDYLKKAERRRSGDLKFYYGTSTNVFWKWYSAFVDPNVQPTDIRAIQNSLEQRDIGITNIILKASRKGRSSFDYDLQERTYNDNFFNLPLKKECIKILCTSKAVLNEMLIPQLEKSSLKCLINQDMDNALHELIYSSINANSIKNPICAEISLPGEGSIECVALPSPGSPFRGLEYFGKMETQKSKEFLRQYLKSTFSWFLS